MGTSTRIIEIEWAAKNDKAFLPSPKREKAKKKAKKRSARSPSLMPLDPGHPKTTNNPQMEVDDEWRDEEEVEDEIVLKGKGKSGVFGLEVTNSPSKRSVGERGKDGEAGDVETPPKRQKKTNSRKKKVIIEVSSDDEWAPMKRGKRKVAA